jgi:predicted RNase H-like HicB family nuclease
VRIDTIPVQVEVEEDGRILASVPDLPGVMAYGATESEAIARVRTIVLEVVADMVASGEDVPESLRALAA